MNLLIESIKSHCYTLPYSLLSFTLKTFYRYLYSQLIRAASISILVITALFVLLNVLKDVITLLMNSAVGLSTILYMILLLVPFVLMFTIPWGLLVAVLLVFGRISQDRELLAIKSSGIGLATAIAPAIILSLIASLLLLFINTTLSPAARFAFKQIAADTLRNNPTALFIAGKIIDKFPGYRIYVREKEGNHLTDIHLWTIDPAGNPIRSLRADQGTLHVDLPNQRIVINLINSRQEERRNGAPTDTANIVPGIQAEYLPIEISIEALFKKSSQPPSPGNMTLRQLSLHLLTHAPQLDTSSIVSILTEAHKRIALAFAPLTFTLVGIPLAIQTRRRESSVGVAISLGIVLAYFFILIVAETLKRNTAAHPDMLVWLPNILFQALGIFLIARVNKH
jgi:lipopolysaccharide export system permease protein